MLWRRPAGARTSRKEILERLLQTQDGVSLGLFGLPGSCEVRLSGWLCSDGPAFRARISDLVKLGSAAATLVLVVSTLEPLVSSVRRSVGDERYARLFIRRR